MINPHYHLYLIGNTTGIGDFIRNLVDKYKAKSYIHILGSNDETYKYYSAFDISLLSSISEGFCLAQLEMHLMVFKHFAQIHCQN